MAEADPEISLENSGPADRTAMTSEPARKRQWSRVALMLSVPLALLVAGAFYWLSLQGQVTTDNAYVQQDKVSVSALVGGEITEVLVGEGDSVKEGDLLFRIDAEPYRLQIQQANAAIASAQANVTALANSSDLSGTDISAAREDIAFAQANFDRQDALFQRGFLTKADHDAAQHRLNQAREALRQAQARQQAARAKLATGAAVPGENPQVAAGKAQRAVAELALRRTEVRAPSAGRVAQAERLQLGQQVVQGLPVLTLVEDGSSYVEANFKETDLADMQVGQPAEVHFDAYPGLVLKGHVESIGAGTGSEFSVIPAQNATGNWVKVTQRVPVRIAIDEKSPRPLIAGLSTEVTVFTDGKKH
ncbi:HlyD family efflux transporter periplasmic adaptor subunit [Erythrobacter gaetbuli]|uniref:HlyD family efflux transporter periplasmic adaptor subunit n=1 Tax=Qipengyuania gaetbuli TaxID=266952 RepID=A0A844XYV7_9SPHN|nr:HlyD family secretion protein [Qipengyuania gaetbuli]MXO50283.1 HlyD family efflux transporter periplasmic adaptor subunit [Qipengyuania gaetbuli]